MTRTKNKKSLKVVASNKSNAKKPKGLTIKLKNFGDVLVDKKLKFQKDLALGLDRLFSVEETIRKEIIPTIAQVFYTYIVWLKKNSPMKYKDLQKKDLLKYAWDLVSYKRKTGIGGGRKIANESFEHNVARACMVAQLMDKQKLTIKKNVIGGISKDVSPLRFYENSNGKELSEPNPRTEWEKARSQDVQEMFNRFILGKTTKYSSKSSKKKGNTKNTKAKPVSFENKLMDINKTLNEINLMKPSKLEETMTSTKLSYLKSIAQYVLLIVAKLKTLEKNADGKVKSTNELLFNADQAIKQSKVKIFGTAVLELSKEPQVASKK